MARRPPEALKRPAARLARILASGRADPARLEARARGLGLRLFHPEAAPAPAPADEEPGRIGVYRRRQAGFERDPALAERFDIWADVPRIPPKGGRRRIVLLGESVARGYFFLRDATPARVLERELNRASPKKWAEVVDLSETSQQFWDLLESVESCLALKPDAIVVFAGNNWIIQILGMLLPEQLEKIASALAAGRFGVIQRLMEDHCEAIAGMFVKTLHGLSKRCGSPILLIWPETNLQDWRRTPQERMVSLVNKDTRRWVRARRRAEAALAAGRPERIEREARRMLSLNPLHPIAYEWLADISLRRGERQEGRRLLEAARDCSLYPTLRAKPAPQALSVMRGAVLSEARRRGMAIVDLPEVFERHLGDELPDRRLFMDYCHMTAEGIRVSMTAAARPLRALFGRAEPRNEANGSDEVDAFGHFLAAIHNAHWGQSGDVVRHHCRIGASSREVARFMADYALMASSRTPWELSGAYARSEASGLLALNRGGVRPFRQDPERQRLIDARFVDTIVAALMEVGIFIRGDIERRRREEHGVAGRTVSLLESYEDPACHSGRLYGSSAAFHQAPEIFSRFQFVARRSAELSLKLTYRLPGERRARGWIRLLINGAPAARWPAAGRWRTRSLTVPRRLLVEGVNSLRIEWPGPRPSPPGTRAGGPRQAIAALVDPVCGHIHRLAVTGGRR